MNGLFLPEEVSLIAVSYSTLNHAVVLLGHILLLHIFDHELEKCQDKHPLIIMNLITW